VPANRKRELQPGWIDDFAVAPAPEQPQFEQVLLAAAASRDGFRGATGRALVRQQSFQDVDRGRERRADRAVFRLAVPTAVFELLAQRRPRLAAPAVWRPSPRWLPARGPPRPPPPAPE
jgi:hypothetical protein